MSWDRFNDQFRETHDETQDRWRATTARRKAEGKCWQCAKLIAECKCPNVNHPSNWSGQVSQLVLCLRCQTEGRILTSDGGPDDVDHGECPECNGQRVVEVECELITMEDLDVRSTRD